MKEVYINSRSIYGSPKITKKLNQKGIKVSQKTVTRIMKAEGIRSKTIKKYKATTNSKHSLPVYPNLLNQEFQVDAPGKVWVADITYIHTGEGWLYLATIMDLYSRRILGWHMNKRAGNSRTKTRSWETKTNRRTYSSFRSWQSICVT